jgi:DNA-directed RNA polymerase subunit RPC12/RpoP
LADQIQGKEIIVRCAKCGRRLFDIISNWNTLEKSSPIEMVCHSCGAKNLITIEKKAVKVELIE